MKRAWATAVAVALVFAGCTQSPSAERTDEPGATVTTARAVPSLDWSDCGAAHCATLTVPLDHDQPEAGTIELAILKVPASAEPRLGALLVNPGGPGGSGRDFAQGFLGHGLDQFDVIGWDPRGVGASHPVVCADGAAMDAYLATDGSPDNPAEEAELTAAVERFAQSCRANTGALIDQLSVSETVRDLDLLRQALGEAELNFLGVSYGSLIGAAYASWFPGSVGRMVLDAAVDPRDPAAVPQSRGYEEVLGALAQWCLATSCALGDDPVGRVQGLITELDTAPIRVGDRELTQTLAVSGLTTILAGGERSWPSTVDAITAAERGDGSRLLAAADLLSGRQADGSYSGFLAAFVASYCADQDVRSAAVAAERWAAERKQAPVFGYGMGTPYLCVGWTAAPADPLALPVDPAKPILVLGGPGDPVTPFPGAEALATALSGSVLVPTPGYGHGSFLRGNACVDDLIRARLLDDAMPAPGSSCV
ncbi:MAG: alpha/beta fold hydrolase [Propioniciclava sp.]